MSNVQKWIVVEGGIDAPKLDEQVKLHDFPGDAQKEAKDLTAANGEVYEVWELNYYGKTKRAEVVFEPVYPDAKP